MRCPFCERLATSEVVASDDLTAAVADGFPISPGHTLVIPRSHVGDFFSLSSEEQTAMWQMVSTVKRILEDQHHPDAFNVGINIGDAAGQTVGHAHIHVVPRYSGDVADPRGGVRWIIPSKARYWSRGPEQADDRGVIGFAEKMLGLLDEGRFTATYKYAVLLGLMDLCIENTTASGTPPDVVTTDQLAEKVLELYWSHTTGETVYVQNVGQNTQAEILSDISKFRSRHAPDPSATLFQSRSHAADAFQALLRRIEWKLIEMPLPRVQIIGNSPDAFLYDIGWDTAIKRRDIDHPTFSRAIRFKPNVSEYLVQLNGLLRPLIQRKWAAMVAKLNRLEDARLERVLFGFDRIATTKVRAALWDLQARQCFYCGDRISSPDGCEVDHFIPWARYPDNGIHNFVVADPRCNGNKRDFLAASAHVQRWAARFDTNAKLCSDLKAIGEQQLWEQHPERTIGVARATYLHLPNGAKLWMEKKEFEDADVTLLARVLR
jgi:diadenosine tetraphosphate (Ap4A) HIT family hydrolase/5-methylcytosine-specific restriction endonuclease McrA